MALELRRFELIEEWMAGATPVQCEAMRVWVSALNGDPRQLASGPPLRRSDGKGFPMYVAFVPGTDAAVAFTFHAYPVRVVTFVRVLSSVDADDYRS